MKKIFSNRIISVASSVLVSVMAVALVGYAASTISTNITTDGTLRVTGTFTAKGTADFDSTSATTTISGGLRADTADNTLVVDFSSSRVGIGTTSPSSLFSVTGASVFGGAVNVTGDLAFTGTSATTTLHGGFRADTFDNTLVVDFSSSRVGIGTTSPSALFSVSGGSSILGGPVTMFGPSTAMGVFTVGNLVATSTAATSTLEWGFAIETNGLLYAADTNRVGVGTTSPGSALSVQAGNAQITGTTTTSALHATSTVYVGATGNLFLVNAAGSVGVATTSPGNLLSVSGSTLFGSADADIVSLRAGDIRLNANSTTTVATKNLMGINVNSGDLVLDTESNKLYVGTSTPVRGNLAVDGTGTTTLGVYTTTASPRGTCIELNNATNGGLMRIYATSSDIGTLRVEPGACTDGS